MQSIMQKNEPPIRVLGDVKSDMNFTEFLEEMDTANLRETRIYFSSSAISQNIGLPRATYILYLERVTSPTSTVLAFPLTNSKNFYKLNKTSSTWGSWITIDNDSIEATVTNLGTQVATNTTDISNLQTATNNRKMSHRYKMSTQQSTIDMVLDPNHSNPNIYADNIEIRMVNGIIVLKVGYRFASGASLNAGEQAEVGMLKSNLIPDYNLGYIRGSLTPSYYTPARFPCECDISSSGTITIFNGSSNNWGDNQALQCSFMYLCPTMRDLSTFETYFESNPNVEIYD